MGRSPRPTRRSGTPGKRRHPRAAHCSRPRPRCTRRKGQTGAWKRCAHRGWGRPQAGGPRKAVRAARARRSLTPRRAGLALQALGAFPAPSQAPRRRRRGREQAAHPALAARGHRGNYTPHCRRLPARRRGPLLPAPPPQTLKALCTQAAPFPLLPRLSGLARHAHHWHRSPGARCPGPGRAVGIQSRGNPSSRFCPPTQPGPG